MGKRSHKAEAPKREQNLQVDARPGESDAAAMVRTLLEPNLRHAISASDFGEKALGYSQIGIDFREHYHHLQAAAEKAEAGDLSICSRLLAAQALTLDNMFTELARRAALNLGEYLDTSERYGRLALKAQANCRSTLEALAKLHQPREQTVRHVHVNEGGQAIVTDQFHNHKGGGENGKPVKQSHATDETCPGTALPSPDPKWQGVPISSGQRPKTMQDVRRDKPRSA